MREKSLLKWLPRVLGSALNTNQQTTSAGIGKLQTNSSSHLHIALIYNLGEKKKPKQRPSQSHFIPVLRLRESEKRYPLNYYQG